MKIEGKIEGVVILLMGSMVFFTIATFVARWRFPTDGVLFTVMSGCLTGASASFFTRIKGPDQAHPPGTTSATMSVETVPPEVK